MPPTSLEHEHTPEAIALRIQTKTHHSSLGDFVLGSIDGTITTFAIVAGVAGANLTAGVALVLGLANVLADGFSMAVGNYLKARSDNQMIHRYRRMEERHIERIPEGEREEIRHIFAAKGFSGELLDQIVEVIESDHKQWVDTMLTEEWGIPLESPSPPRAAWVTFLAFVLAGMVPLLPLFLSPWLGPENTFLWSAIATAATFAVIGAIRGRITGEPPWWTSIETLAMGGIAATLAYAVGNFLRGYTEM